MLPEAKPPPGNAFGGPATLSTTRWTIRGKRYRSPSFAGGQAGLTPSFEGDEE